MPILEWLNKEEAVKTADKVPYRVLKANKKLSYGEQSENMIIKGDNLEALKALLPYYKGQVKCIYIDPPYNTGNAFEYYDDNLEHSTWLSMMYPRLELLRELLREDGFICCQIDDSESHYLKVIMDEIFGRDNYVNTFYVQVRYANKTLKSDMKFHKQIEQIHIYRNSRMAQPNLPTEDNAYDNFVYSVKLLKDVGELIELGGKKVEIFQKGEYKIVKNKMGNKTQLKEVWASGTILDGNSSGRFFRDYLTGRYNADGYGVLYKVYGIGDDQYDYRYFTGPQKIGATKGKYYQGVPVSKLDGNTERKIPIENFYNLSGSFGNCRLEGNADFRSGKKPEVLLKMILEYFSNENDMVLDSFLGSASTVAVAQKTGRRYIGIEMGEHAITHCVPRMKAVIDGEQGGISKAVNWQGGGGYTFYDLGETIFDENGNINKKVDFKTLASHIWFTETKTPLTDREKSPLLGIHNGIAYYLLFNGILGDKKPDGGNVLTQKVLDSLPQFKGTKVIYGEATRINTEKLKVNNIVFKQTPYDVKAR